jgi:acid phosphatase class B
LIFGRAISSEVISFNSGTHTAHLNEQRPFFLIFLDDNARNMQNYPISIGLFFIEDFIFLVKKNFFDQILKVSFKEKF